MRVPLFAPNFAVENYNKAMTTFESFKINKFLLNALNDLGFEHPTPIQEASFTAIRSGKDTVGIAQTGTGKTLAYSLPILEQLPFSKQTHPRVLILVPTRELVLQVVKMLQDYSQYMSTRVVGVYGGTNINTQKLTVLEGCDIIVGTPGRLYDLVLAKALNLKDIKKMVIDEVDVMLDEGFLFQLTNIFELLPEKRQNIMFSATMTDHVNQLIQDFFVEPQEIAIAVSGTPLENIEQKAYPALNFNTKINLLNYLLDSDPSMEKIIIFMSSKKLADRLIESEYYRYSSTSAVIHANKSQNYRINALQSFNEGDARVLIATDVVARGIDFDRATHVINFDTPAFPENYMHRIGRTGRAKEKGKSILFFTDKEGAFKKEIEKYMNLPMLTQKFPEEVGIITEIIPEERKKVPGKNAQHQKEKNIERGDAFHEKKEKNQKTVLSRKELEEKRFSKFKRPKTRGQKQKGKRK